MARLSSELQRTFLDNEHPPHVTLQELLTLAEERVFGVLFVVLALPSALPVPAPGYSVPFGVMIFLLSVQMIAGSKQPWFPQKFSTHPVALSTVQGILKKALPRLRNIEAITRPRFLPICTSVPGRIIIGCILALMGISMMIPIPGTNTVPAIGIFVTGFGLLEDDGAISLGGLVISLFGAAITISILVAFIWGGSSLIEIIKGWLEGLWN
ncbi:exopolysaccharide biosynthesis protein [Acaryochloris sp. CCMEE 5410]|uniref:exopolysaccharide biosynthesis protein n=1 Tax=Acaryochloris sp. CCMEE 5410 TaxID=310037 RepID=UPI000248388F|nr:exopolysaccharide biosynthesis protein [Acaryochloris sp. CCMEE 5410]KAI9133810.1 exopolysaccharide biosynthesis protein [Acaryochloris sp. CCMEE 5410]